MPPLDHDRCYAAASSRDARFDGWFVTAVRTTGIYCRPSCPAITPKSTNVEFFHTPAAAQQRGFRACKRCRPDATPGSPEWNVRQDVVGRAMRLIADGAVERVGVSGLAQQLGYSERHLNRLLTDEVGAGPLAVARAQRAQTARLLVETTDLRLTDVAFAAGFGSVRQFNDTVREVFAASPSELRRAAQRRDGGHRDEARSSAVGATVSLRLPTRPPFAGRALIEFLAARAIGGVESVPSETMYRRTLDLPGGHGVVTVRVGADLGSVASPTRPPSLRRRVGDRDDSLAAADLDASLRDAAPSTDALDHVAVTLRLTDWADLSTAVQRIRRMLDLDADAVAIDRHLGREPVVAPFVAASPGRRAPTGATPYEVAVRAIVGQQVSVSGARTVAGQIVSAVGEPLTLDDDELTHVVPSPERLAAADDQAFAMPASRRDTLRRLARSIVAGDLRLDAGSPPDEVRTQLLAIKGIGPWTADYVVMRGLGHPDTMLGSDLVVRQVLAAHGIAADEIDRATVSWAPWRSYAVHHLWANHHPASSGSPAPTRSRARTRT